MRLKNFWKFVLGEGKIGINRRVTRILRLISTATMILAGIVIFAGLLVARNSAIDMGKDLGRESFENRAEILREQKSFELLNNANRRGRCQLHYQRNGAHRFTIYKGNEQDFG